MSPREPIQDTAKVFRTLTDEGYALDWPAHQVSLELRYLHRQKHELFGELEVHCAWGGIEAVQGVIFTGNFNVSSLRGRSEIGAHLERRTHSEKTVFDWVGFLEEFCRRCVLAERAGSDVIDLCDVPAEVPIAVWNAGGIPVLSQLPVIWFGDGGAAKSYLALYVAGELAKQGHRVLYADWEFSGAEHRDRWFRLFGSLPPTIKYVRCARSMALEVDHLCRIVKQYDIDYLIADSVAFAMAEEGPPEDAKVAVAYFAALRRIGVGSLNLAHQTKATEGAEYKPFGSTFWHNGARMTWHLKGVQDGEVPRNQMRVAMYNRKNNIGQLHATLGWGLEFAPVRTFVFHVDPADTAELAKGLPLVQRIKDELKLGPQTIATLADALDVKPNTVYKTAQRYDQKYFRKVDGLDGIARIHLVGE